MSRILIRQIFLVTVSPGLNAEESTEDAIHKTYSAGQSQTLARRRFGSIPIPTHLSSRSRSVCASNQGTEPSKRS